MTDVKSRIAQAEDKSSKKAITKEASEIKKAYKEKRVEITTL